MSHQEQTELRGSLGGTIGNVNERTGPQRSAAMVQDRASNSSGQDMIEANRFVQQVKKESGQAIRIFSFPTEKRSASFGSGDAALQNRTCSSEKALQGEHARMSVISI